MLPFYIHKGHSSVKRPVGSGDHHCVAFRYVGTIVGTRGIVEVENGVLLAVAEGAETIPGDEGSTTL
jgi:hypothetical protein